MSQFYNAIYNLDSKKRRYDEVLYQFKKVNSKNQNKSANLRRKRLIFAQFSETKFVAFNTTTLKLKMIIIF